MRCTYCGRVSVSVVSLALTIAVTAVVPLLARTAQGQDIPVAAGDVAGLVNAITTANGMPGNAATIHISGTYTLASSMALGIPFAADGNNGLPSITTDVTIVGMGAVIERDSTPGCSLDSTASPDEFRIFHVASTGKLTLDGITVRNGCADGPMFVDTYGGGILNYGETDLRGTTLSNNMATYGGGILNSDGTVNVLDKSVLSDNHADNSGGGIENDGTGAMLHVTESVLSHDDAQYFGGGISNFNGKVYLTRSTISHNDCGTEGGGVFNTFNHLNVPVLDIVACTFDDNEAPNGGGIHTSEKVDIVDSTFSQNRASDGNGGAIWKEGLELNVTNSTFSGNVAAGMDSGTGMGGGIYNDSFVLNVTSCTFSGNSASNGGGGIFAYDTLNITNSIVANSLSGGDCGVDNTDLVAAGANFDTDGTCKTAAIGSGTDAFFTTVSSAELNLDVLALNPPGSTATFALLADSVAIDAVPPGECTVVTDQRGVSRPQGGRCDSGAYEVRVPTAAPAPALSTGGLILLAVLLALVPWYQSRRERLRLPSREVSS